MNIKTKTKEELLNELERLQNEHYALQALYNKEKKEPSLIAVQQAESEPYNRMLFEKSIISLALTSVDGKITDVNQAFANLIGRTIEETLHLSYWDITPQKYEEQEKQHLESLILSGSYGPYEKEFIHKNGQLIPVRLHSLIIERMGEKFILSSIEDISNQKLAEKELRESEEKYRLLFINNPQPMWIYDLETLAFLEVNDAAISHYGYSLEEFLEMTIKDIRPTEDIPALMEDLEKTWRNLNMAGEWKHIKKNNEIIVVEITSHTLISNNKNARYVLINDITERKLANQKLAKEKEKAEESDRLKSAFLANMSHEIRTPMNGILGFAELLKEPELSGEQQQKYIQIIEKSGARMLNIINDIVSISKIESGIVDIHLSEMNINNQLQFICHSLKFDADTKKINLSFNCALPEEEAIIKTDIEKFNGILSNLVKNAIKYTDIGKIEFGYTKKEEEIEFYVKDTGIGIPKDKQEAIFERFIQADITDKMARQGAGLGLAIARAYVDLLGGKIWVESEEAKGSTFFFTLPSNLDDQEKIKKPASFLSENEGEPIIPENSGLKVLIAEDDEASEMLISIELENFSKEILKVTTGKDAIEVCRQHPDIDLVLMDIQMAEINGYDATRKIREFNKDVIIIAQTAFALTGDKEIAIEAGCNDYISKPIMKEKLLVLIQKYFKK